VPGGSAKESGSVAAVYAGFRVSTGTSPKTVAGSMAARWCWSGHARLSTTECPSMVESTAETLGSWT
jgi:hypothetical protein